MKVIFETQNIIKYKDKSAKVSCDVFAKDEVSARVEAVKELKEEIYVYTICENLNSKDDKYWAISIEVIVFERIIIRSKVRVSTSKMPYYDAETAAKKYIEDRLEYENISVLKLKS